MPGRAEVPRVAWRYLELEPVAGKFFVSYFRDRDRFYNGRQSGYAVMAQQGKIQRKTPRHTLGM